MKPLAALSLAIFFAVNLSAAEGSHPPIPYIDEGACPFECCTYGEWTVDAATPLLETPTENATVLGIVANGERVVGLTGNVETLVPGRIEVLRSFRSETSKVDYRVGDIVSVYSSLGEGFYRVWHGGKFYEEEASFYGIDSEDRCTGEGTCWGKSLNPPSNVWWVKVKTRTGLIGWSKEAEHFGGKDACG